ncbi:MAG: 2-amino-4-hydroxy-6-hydroxymethyldihydropteridine diphosphokinase [Clostridia bacterium]|nr:2-amino-4-hydroxy-6-hydroxymethyldihydropteridine diphosphokinase [Clostridia bacterium]
MCQKNRQSVTAYLGLGSNLGDRMAYLRRAIDLLGQEEGMCVEQVSSWYETSPVGKADQAWFLNCVVKVATTLAPRQLLHTAQKIESLLGRVRLERWGPRTIDIDLLLYDEVSLNEPDLVLPHPRLLERAFVLKPLAEIAPDLVLPGGLTAREAAGHDFPGQKVLLFRANQC